MTDYVLKNKRKWNQRKQQQLKQQQQTDDYEGGDEGGDAGGCSGGRAGGADRTMDCPIISALRSGEDAARRARSVVAEARPAGPPADEKTKPDWTKLPPPPPALLEKMKRMSADELLDFLASMGVKAAADIRTSRAGMERNGHVASKMKGAVANAKLEMHTEEGRRKYETLLTASVYGRGDEPSAAQIPKRMAEILDVSEGDMCSALKRAKWLDPELDPEEAIQKGVYWFESPAGKSYANDGETRG